MYIPTNHERLQTISEVLREELTLHEINGGAYYDEVAGQLAAKAIQRYMPILGSLQDERILIEAHTGILLTDRVSTPHVGVKVEARLERVAIKSLVQIVDSSDRENSPVVTSYDLFAVMRPRYVDPDPQDIIFGDELYVPFEGIQLFEPVDA